MFKLSSLQFGNATGLFAQLQRDYRGTIAGPTKLAACRVLKAKVSFVKPYHAREAASTETPTARSAISSQRAPR